MAEHMDHAGFHFLRYPDRIEWWCDTHVTAGVEYAPVREPDAPMAELR